MNMVFGILVQSISPFASTVPIASEYWRVRCDVICYVKFQAEIDWLVKQSTAQQLLSLLVGDNVYIEYEAHR
jgi:hypothetical protein